MSLNTGEREMKNLKQAINEAIEARREAIDEAKRRCPVVRSRGVYLTVGDAKDTLISGGDCWEVRLTQKSLNEEIESVLKHLGRPVEELAIYISGAVDGADSVYEMNEGEYEPMVECWDVELTEILGA